MSQSTYLSSAICLLKWSSKFSWPSNVLSFRGAQKEFIGTATTISVKIATTCRLRVNPPYKNPNYPKH